MLIKANTPIVDDDGAVRALLSYDKEWRSGEVLFWTWFCPTSHRDIIAGPQYEDDSMKVPVNRGELSVDYHRGDVSVLRCVLHGDERGAFSNHLFSAPDEPVGESWCGKVAAVRVLREYADSPMVEQWLDYIGGYFAERAGSEGG